MAWCGPLAMVSQSSSCQMRTLENGVEVVRRERLKTDLDSVNTKRKKMIFVFERTTVLSFLGTQYVATVQMEQGTNSKLAFSKILSGLRTHTLVRNLRPHTLVA